MKTFFFIMCLYPDIQRRAQEEIENFIGKDALPKADDRQSLPYVEAVMLESLRWQLVFPLALPHAAQVNSIVNGYFIPKGTIIMANNW